MAATCWDYDLALKTKATFRNGRLSFYFDEDYDYAEPEPEPIKLFSLEVHSPRINTIPETEDEEVESIRPAPKIWNSRAKPRKGILKRNNLFDSTFPKERTHRVGFNLTPRQEKIAEADLPYRQSFNDQRAVMREAKRREKGLEPKQQPAPVYLKPRPLDLLAATLKTGMDVSYLDDWQKFMAQQFPGHEGMDPRLGINTGKYYLTNKMQIFTADEKLKKKDFVKNFRRLVFAPAKFTY